MKKYLKFPLLLGLLVIACLAAVAQQGETLVPDSFYFEGDSTAVDTLQIDSNASLSVKSGDRFSLLDSISNDTLLNRIFKSYIGIQHTYIERKAVRKNMPTVKEIKERSVLNNQWKFWVVLFILAYIAFVRISNANNFRVFLLSVFNLKLSRKIWEDQRSFFGFVILQLFAIYLFIAAMFITNYMEMKQLLFLENYFQQFAAVLAILLILYLSKFLLHAVLGSLLGMQNLAIGSVSNTISVNNFVALVIFPFAVLGIYATNNMLAGVLAQTIIAIFMLSILYRVVRILLLSNSFFSFPTFYLFLYLCALEIAPWFIIVKFLNNYHA